MAIRPSGTGTVVVMTMYRPDQERRLADRSLPRRWTPGQRSISPRHPRRPHADGTLAHKSYLRGMMPVVEGVAAT